MMSEWMPIESAPRDGTQILAVSPNGTYIVIRHTVNGWWPKWFEDTKSLKWRHLPGPAPPDKIIEISSGPTMRLRRCQFDDRSWWLVNGDTAKSFREWHALATCIIAYTEELM